jgi:hypothetical protein
MSSVIASPLQQLQTKSTGFLCLPLPASNAQEYPVDSVDDPVAERLQPVGVGLYSAWTPARACCRHCAINVAYSKTRKLKSEEGGLKSWRVDSLPFWLQMWLGILG